MLLVYITTTTNKWNWKSQIGTGVGFLLSTPVWLNAWFKHLIRHCSNEYMFASSYKCTYVMSSSIWNVSVLTGLPSSLKTQHIVLVFLIFVPYSQIEQNQKDPYATDAPLIFPPHHTSLAYQILAYQILLPPPLSACRPNRLPYAYDLMFRLCLQHLWPTRLSILVVCQPCITAFQMHQILFL